MSATRNAAMATTRCHAGGRGVCGMRAAARVTPAKPAPITVIKRSWRRRAAARSAEAGERAVLACVVMSARRSLRERCRLFAGQSEECEDIGRQLADDLQARLGAVAPEQTDELAARPGGSRPGRPCPGGTGPSAARPRRPRPSAARPCGSGPGRAVPRRPCPRAARPGRPRPRAARPRGSGPGAPRPGGTGPGAAGPRRPGPRAARPGGTVPRLTVRVDLTLDDVDGAVVAAVGLHMGVAPAGLDRPEAVALEGLPL